jgi:hypothetical protein
MEFNCSDCPEIRNGSWALKMKGELVNLLGSRTQKLGMEGLGNGTRWEIGVR